MMIERGGTNGGAIPSQKEIKKVFGTVWSGLARDAACVYIEAEFSESSARTLRDTNNDCKGTRQG